MADGRPGGLAQERVLLLHNRYRTAGGEERFVDALERLLREHCAFVARAERASDALGPARAAAGLLAGGLAPDAVAEQVRADAITVVHAHNVHPSFGWRALAAARRAGAATVLHLHNHRLFCATGVAYRDGEVCYDCAPRATHHGVRHRCRDGGLAEAAVYAAGIAAWQRRLLAAADRVATPTAELAERLRGLGVPLGETSVLGGWVPDEAFAATPTTGGAHALYAGRLTEDKGVLVAIRASAASGVPLVVAGDGPQAGAARALAAALGAPVRFMGQTGRDELAALRRDALCAVVPSRCQEVLPLSGIEALAAGLPLVVSDRPGLVPLTEPELVAAAGDHEALASVLRAVAGDAALRSRAAAAALARARERFTAGRAAEAAAGLYADARARGARP